MRDDWRTAVIEGDCRAIEGLLEDTDIDCRDHYGQTALMLAVLHGREEVASLLLEKGADLNVTAKYRLSALMLAVIRGHEAIARQLVDAGANLELRGTGAPASRERQLATWRLITHWLILPAISNGPNANRPSFSTAGNRRRKDGCPSAIPTVLPGGRLATLSGAAILRQQ